LEHLSEYNIINGSQHRGQVGLLTWIGSWFSDRRQKKGMGDRAKWSARGVSAWAALGHCFSSFISMT